MGCKMEHEELRKYVNGGENALEMEIMRVDNHRAYSGRP
jgi:hypothetical protein